MENTQNITILGAGIMGLMCAYALSKSGHNITLIDPKGFPANNASFMAGGMLAPYSEIEHMDMHWVEAGLKGVQFWEDFDLDVGFKNYGSLVVAHPDDEYILQRFKTHLPNSLQHTTKPHELEPALDSKFQKAISLDEEAHLDPQKTMSALCEYLKAQKNVQLITDTPELSPTETLIDCRGMAANDESINPKIRGVKGETLLVRNTDFSLKRPVRLMHPRYPLYIIPRENDTFMIGATMIESAYDEIVSVRSSMELMSALHVLSPSFIDAQILDMRAGIRPSYPDNLPRITLKDNVISCNGLFRHGYLFAPLMAQYVSDYLADQKNEHWHLFTSGDDNESHDKRAA